MLNEQFFIVMRSIEVSIGSTLLFFALPYVMLRVRDWRAGTRDRQLGFKVALHFLFTQAAWIAMVGLSILVGAITNSAPGKTALYSSGGGMIIAGGLAIWGFTWALRRSNDHLYLAVRKTYSGGRMIVAFVVFLSLFTALSMQTLEAIIGPSTATSVGSSNPYGRQPTPPMLPTGDSLVQLALISLLWLGAGVIDLFVLRKAMEKPELPPHEDTCGTCKYQLVGTILSKRSLCPECGATIPAEQAQQVYLRNKHRLKPQAPAAPATFVDAKPNAD